MEQLFQYTRVGGGILMFRGTAAALVAAHCLRESESAHNQHGTSECKLLSWTLIVSPPIVEHAHTAHAFDTARTR